MATSMVITPSSSGTPIASGVKSIAIPISDLVKKYVSLAPHALKEKSLFSLCNSFVGTRSINKGHQPPLYSIAVPVPPYHPYHSSYPIPIIIKFISYQRSLL